MKLATTTADFDRYCTSFCDAISCVAEAGFRYIDLDLNINKMEEGLTGDDWKKGVQTIKDHADRLGVQFVQSHVLAQQSLHGPNVNAEKVRKDIIRCIEVCGALGIPSMVMHAQRSDEFSFVKEKWMEANRKDLLSFAPYFEEAGVEILMENGPLLHAMAFQPDGKPYDPPKYYCSSTSGAILKEFVEYMDHPMVHACWDTGHANMNGPQYDDIVTLGSQLRALHVHDNRGALDEHGLPFLGTLNLDELMHALLDSGYQGYFTFEACNPLGSPRIHRNRHPFPQDNRLSKPSRALAIAAEKFMYQMGKEILSAYDLFEE